MPPQGHFGIWKRLAQRHEGHRRLTQQSVARPHERTDPRLEQLGYVDQLLDLVGDATVGQTAEQARLVLEVICAAYASAGSAEPVSLPFTGDRSATPMQLWRN